MMAAWLSVRCANKRKDRNANIITDIVHTRLRSKMSNVRTTTTTESNLNRFFVEIHFFPCILDWPLMFSFGSSCKWKIYENWFLMLIIWQCQKCWQISSAQPTSIFGIRFDAKRFLFAETRAAAPSLCKFRRELCAKKISVRQIINFIIYYIIMFYTPISVFIVLSFVV